MFDSIRGLKPSICELIQISTDKPSTRTKRSFVLQVVNSSKKPQPTDLPLVGNLLNLQFDLYYKS